MRSSTTASLHNKCTAVVCIQSKDSIRVRPIIG